MKIHFFIGASFFGLPFQQMIDMAPRGRHKWILFEPNPQARQNLVNQLRLEGADNSDVIVDPRAVSTYNGKIMLQGVDFDKISPMGEDEWIGGISSVISPKNSGRTLTDQPAFTDSLRAFEVDCVTLNDVFQEYVGMQDKIETLVLDVEGHEFDILGAFDWQIPVLPQFMKIETKHNTKPIEPILHKLRELGYMVFKEVDDIYCTRIG